MSHYSATACETVPYLVSFPRTGSHWLRMFLEQYFDRPLLTRSFFRHANDDFLLLHVHDNQKPVAEKRDTLYLYRGVSATLFSELTYRHGAGFCAPGETAPAWETVEACAREYMADLEKWLVRREMALRMHVLTYERLLDRPLDVLPGVIEFLGGEPDTERIAQLWPTVTHAGVAEKTPDNPKVIDRGADKELRRELFRYRFGARLRAMFEANTRLAREMDPALLA